MTENIIFHEELQIALETAKRIAQEARQQEYTPAHLLKAILHRDLTLLKELEVMGKDVFFIEEWAEVRIEEFPKSMKPVEAEAHQSIDDVIAEADAVRDILGREEVDLLAVMIALSTPGVGFNFDQMKSFPVTRAELLTEREDGKMNIDLLNLPSERSISKYIHKYCFNKTAKAKKNKLEIVGRDKEIKEIIEVLCRF